MIPLRAARHDEDLATPRRFGLLAAGRFGAHVAELLEQRGAAPACLLLDAGNLDDQNDRIESALHLPDQVPVILAGGPVAGEVVERLGGLELDLLILAWWPRLVRGELLRLPRLGCLNLHPSLLPHQRGKHYNFWAIVEGSPFGVTMHWLDEGVDTGPIAWQRELAVEWADTGATLYARAQAALLELLAAHLDDVLSGEIPRQPQPCDIGSAHHSSELDAASRIELDRSYTGREMLNLLRARTFPPHPAAWFEDGGRRYEARIAIDEIGIVERAAEPIAAEGASRA